MIVPVVTVPYIFPLPEEYMENCKVLPLREDILTRLPKGGVCVEIGVADGYFSRFILDYLQPKKLHLVDHFTTEDTHCSKDHQYKCILTRFAKEIQEGQVEVDKGMSQDILPTFPDQYFDYMYVDADHTYEGVKRDLQFCKTKIKPNGIIQLNDYKLEPSPGEVAYGIIQATNEFCLENNYEILYFAFNVNMYSDVALRKRK